MLAEKRNIVYDESASSPNSNTSPMLTDDVHTMEDNVPQNELIPRDTTVFCILDKLSEIINNLNQQLHEEKYTTRRKATPTIREIFNTISLLSCYKMNLARSTTTTTTVKVTTFQEGLKHDWETVEATITKAILSRRITTAPRRIVATACYVPLLRLNLILQRRCPFLVICTYVGLLNLTSS